MAVKIPFQRNRDGHKNSALHAMDDSIKELFEPPDIPEPNIFISAVEKF